MKLSELQIWVRSVDLALKVYKITETFPSHELYGLTAQMRKASVSVPSNISEGSRRGTANDFIHFIRIASGSLAELQTQLIIAEKLSYLSKSTWSEIEAEIDQIHRMIHVFQSKLSIESH